MTGFSKDAQLGQRKPKNPGKIRKVTNEMAARNAEYHRVLDEIDQEREPVCEDTGIPSFEHSHLIPRNYKDYAFMNVKENIRRNCREVHLNWESGKVYLIRLGKEYLEIVRSLDEQYYRQKMEQFRKRYEEYKNKNWLAISNGSVKVPGWVEEMLQNFQ